MVLFIISRKKEEHQIRESMISSEKLTLKHDQDDLIAKKRGGKKLIVFLRFYKRRKLKLLHEVHTSLIMSVTFASKVRYDVGIFMHITKEVCFCFDNLQWFSSQDTSHHF